MPSISFTVTGTQRVIGKLNRLAAAGRGRVLGDAVLAGAAVLVTEAKRQASGRPGPRVVTGNLRSSIHQELTEVAPTRAVAQVGPGRQAPYGKFLEFGTSRMPAYPFMRPTVAVAGRRAVRETGRALERAVEAATR